MNQARWLSPALLLGLALIWTWPAAISGDQWLVGRHFDLPGTVWFIDAAGRVLPQLTDSATAWPQGARYDRPDSWVMLWLAWAFEGVSAVRLHNLLQVLGVWTSAWAAESCARAMGARFPASLVAGVGFGFCGLAATALLEGHVYMLINPWLPLFTWAWWRACGADGRWTHGLLAAGAWSACLLTSAYLGLGASLMAVGLGVGALLKRELNPVVALSAALPVAGVGGLYLSRFLGGSMHEGAPYLADAFSSRAQFMQSGSADLVNLAAATAELDRNGHSMNAWLAATVVGLFLLAPVALKGTGRWRALAVTGVAALILSLGPAIASPARSYLPLPLGLLSGLSAADMLRFPIRLGWVWALSASLVAALVATLFQQKLGRRAWPIALALAVDLFVWGGMPGRQRVQLAQAPSAYAGEGPVLDMYPEYVGPVDEWNAWSQALACLYQVQHQRPIADDCVAPYPDANPRIALQRRITQELLRGVPVRALLQAQGFTAVALHPDLFTRGDRERITQGLLQMDPSPVVSVDGGEHLVAFSVPGDAP